MNKNIKILKRASSVLSTNPELAQSLLDSASSQASPGIAVLHRAWSVLVSCQISRTKGEVQNGQAAALHDAARVFYANEHYDEAVIALELLAFVAYIQGDLTTSIRTSAQAFREVRAAPSYRLTAARAVLWAVPDNQSPAADRLLLQIRDLAAAAPMSTGKAMACCYLAFRDFKEILYRAGYPTDTESYPPLASLSQEEARSEVQKIIAPLEEQLDAIRSCLPGDSVPMMMFAALKGFVHGSASCIRFAAEVGQKCGPSAEPYIHAAIGVAHLRCSESALAVSHLRQCLDAFEQRSRVDESRPWMFYLALALRAEGRYQEAFETMERFLSLGHKAQQLWSRMAEAMRVLEGEWTPELGDSDPPARLLGSKPPYINSSIVWMRNHMHRPIRVPDIVTAAGVSRRTLEMGFRHFRNRTVAEELRLMRMQRALELLQSADSRLAEVRLQVGYRSASNFSKDFRRVFGVVPSRSVILNANSESKRASRDSGARSEGITTSHGVSQRHDLDGPR